MSAGDIAISVRDLSKVYRIYEKPHHRMMQGMFKNRVYYRSFFALEGVSLEMRKGETIGIIGRNGSGKSTFLQLICGTLEPTSGSIEVVGRVAALLELGAGFNPEFTGRENAYLNAAILGLTTAEMGKRFESIEAFAEIGEFMDRPVKTYSSGMFVRLAFSVAIHVEPQIFVVDEALSVGDARFQAKCMDAIKKMKERGTTILFVSHDVASVRSLCDRAVWLDKGKVRMVGDAFPVTARYTQFLFDDDDTQPDPSADVELGAVGSDAAEAVSTEVLAQEVVTQVPSKRGGPINHWGTHIGAIVDAGVFTATGERKNVFTEKEKIFIKVRFRSPKRAARETLSVAFSIKDPRGTDLVVSATWDQRKLKFPAGQDEFEVVFAMDNCLNTGDYLLVVALEDRSSAVIQYYEYIEGAQYFSTLFATKYCGLFIPEVEQQLATAACI